MATYTNNTPTFDNGSAAVWPVLGGNLFYLDNDAISFGRFTGATAMLAGTTIISATLSINFGAFAPLGTDESIQVWGEEAADAVLPVDWADASARSLTTANEDTGSLNGLSSIDIDLTAVIQELQNSINGDVVMLKFANPTYNGTGLQSGPGNLTFELTVEYESTTARPTTLMQCCC